MKGKNKKNICGKYSGPAVPGERIYIDCNNSIVGKFVSIYKRTGDKNAYLTLCEVFVLGEPGKPKKV